MIAQTSILRSDFDLVVRDAARMMAEKEVSSIIVERPDGHYIFTVEDLLRHTHAGGDLDVNVSTLPVHKLNCISIDQSVLTALEQMDQQGDRHLGVVGNGDGLIGVVTYSDILTSIDPTILMERKSIGDLVIRREPVIFAADWVLEDVLHHFRKAEDAVIVVEDRIPIGIITTRDIFEIVSNGRDVTRPLAYYMTSPVITTPSTASINDALLQIKQHHIKRAIIVDEEGRLMGLVTQSELVGFAYGSWINILRHHTTELNELVSLLEQKNRTLELLSQTDALTELGNRRMLHSVVQQEVERMTRYGAALFTLVLIDIDHFKRINDQFGHSAGDSVLRDLSQMLTGIVRRNDVVVRWGGEEFAVLLPSTPLDAARDFADRFRERVQNAEFKTGSRVTISAGVGAYRYNEGEDVFFRRVDVALYQAKQNGRNRVETEAPV